MESLAERVLSVRQVKNFSGSQPNVEAEGSLVEGGSAGSWGAIKE